MRTLFIVLLGLLIGLGGCSVPRSPLAPFTPLTPQQEQAAAEITAREAFDQAVELRLDGFISDGAWVCIQQIAGVINEALEQGEVGVAQSQIRLVRRGAREDSNVCE